MAQMTETQGAPTGTVYWKSRVQFLVQFLGWPVDFVFRLPGAFFEITFSGRQEGSTVSSISMTVG